MALRKLLPLNVGPKPDPSSPGTLPVTESTSMKVLRAWVEKGILAGSDVGERSAGPCGAPAGSGIVLGHERRCVDSESQGQTESDQQTVVFHVAHPCTREATLRPRPGCLLLGGAQKARYAGSARHKEWRPLLAPNGSEVATGAAFHVPHRALKNVNGRYARIGTKSRSPLVHASCGKLRASRPMGRRENGRLQRAERPLRARLGSWSQKQSSRSRMWS
jgi:hypothetical protein